MKAKQVLVKKPALNKKSVSQLDTRQLEQLKAGSNPWLETQTTDPAVCGG